MYECRTFMTYTTLKTFIGMNIICCVVFPQKNDLFIENKNQIEFFFKKTYALPIFRFFFNDLFDLLHFFDSFQLVLCTLIQITRFHLYKLQWICSRFWWCCFSYTSSLHIFGCIVRYLFLKITKEKNILIYTDL